MLVFGHIVILLSHVFWSHGSVSAKTTLIIDQDGGADDAMAIFMALLYEKYFDGPKIIGITTVHGNVDEPQVYNNTQRILDIAGRRDVPIYRGSKTALVKDVPSDNYYGYDGLGDNATVKYNPIKAQPVQAAFALIELSKIHKDLSILTLGSLTNIALAMKLDSELMNRLSQVYVAAGNIFSEKHFQPEFNALMDVEAYHTVTTKGNPQKLILIPFSQIKNSINISIEWRLGVLGSIPTEIMKSLNIFEQVSIKKDDAWFPLDPTAMAIVLNPTLIVAETRYSKNSIHLCGQDRGINKNLFTSLQNSTSRIVYVVKENQFKKFLLEVFSAQLQS